ncbi:MAG: glycosyltransferase family 4 protein, partial [bacterium]
MKPLRLLFADDSWQYDGNTPENRPLGGAHSSLVYLTRALAELGHDVHVFNNCTAPGPFNGVHYHQLAELTATNKFIYSDAFISLRSPRVFRAWINAGVRILWSGDAIDQPVLGNYLKTNEDVRQNIDCIFCKSRWQAWTFMKYFKWPADKTFVTRNAIWPEYFSTEFYEPPDNRLVYTSTPFRGLKLLLTLFPRIIRSVPDAELHVFSSMQVYQHSKEEDRKKYGHIYQLAEQPGVIMHGSVGQRTLAKKLTRCRILAYPNTFPETSCLSVMEAMAAGCVVVTSWLAALPETVGRGGVLVQGIPGSDEYNEAFVEQCVRLLKDRPFWRRTAKAGKEWILNHYTWDKVAVEWSEQINKLLQQNKRKLADIAGWPLPSHQKEIKKIACTDHKNVQKESAVKPLRLVFADNSWAYEDTTPEQAPLGGAHSSLIYLTRALAALGHDVHVYNHCNSPGEFHGVYYHKFQELDKENKFFPADAFIALRNPTFFSNWLNAAVRILWTGDAIDQPNLQILRTQSDIRQNIDYIICKSQWQAWTFMNYLNWPTEKLKVTRNAVWPEYFPKEFPEPQGRRLVYTSTPFRGLELLLRLFPKIYQALPDTRLHVFSSMEVY